MSLSIRKIVLGLVAAAGITVAGSSAAHADYYGFSVVGHPVVSPSVTVGVSPVYGGPVYSGPIYSSVPTVHVPHPHVVPTVSPAWHGVSVPSGPVVVARPRWTAPPVRVMRRVGFWY